MQRGYLETFFSNIESTLGETKVDWENCVVVELDNTAVNVGKNNSIMTWVLAKSRNIFIVLAKSLLPHNPKYCKQSSGMIFRSVRVCDIKDFLDDLLHWFSKNSKRKVTSNFQPYITDSEPSRLSTFFSYKSVSVYPKFEHDIFSAF